MNGQHNKKEGILFRHLPRFYSFSCSSSTHNSVSEGAFFRLQAIAEPITSKLIRDCR